MTSESQAVVVPIQSSLEDRIRMMRRCPARCPMVDTLDQRIQRQRTLIQVILKKHGMTIDELLAIPLEEISVRDEELQLWYHILRDCDYIDSLR